MKHLETPDRCLLSSECRELSLKLACLKGTHKWPSMECDCCAIAPSMGTDNCRNALGHAMSRSSKLAFLVRPQTHALSELYLDHLRSSFQSISYIFAFRFDSKKHSGEQYTRIPLAGNGL